MLKMKSNKLIAIMLSLLLSGLIPAAVTLADELMGDADGAFVINNGGQFVPIVIIMNSFIISSLARINLYP